VKVLDVALENGWHIHTLVYTHPRSDLTLPPLVLIHGYSQSASQYYATAPALAAGYRGQVVCIDHIGCGLSTRDKWDGGFGDTSDLRSAEAQFVTALELWRRAQNYPAMILCGHSMGAYTSVRYCQEHAQRVVQLLLLSPVGVPEPPAVDPAAAPPVLPWYFRLGRYLWNRGYGPFDLARLVGRAVSKCCFVFRAHAALILTLALTLALALALTPPLPSPLLPPFSQATSTLTSGTRIAPGSPNRCWPTSCTTTGSTATFR